MNIFIKLLFIAVLFTSCEEEEKTYTCPAENCSGHGTCQVTSDLITYCLCDEGYNNGYDPYTCIEIAYGCNDKPIIYLYPESEMDVNIRFENPTTVDISYPEYGEDGWNVHAYPDGKLCSEERCYYSLYWEGPVTDFMTFNTGFSVHSDDLISFFEEKLEKLGLNFRESQEFIIYWLPILDKNEWNIIHFAVDEWKRAAQMIVNPAPDSIIRFMMIYKPVSSYIDLEPQQLTTPERKGFTLVEWGGREDTGEFAEVSK